MVGSSNCYDDCEAVSTDVGIAVAVWSGGLLVAIICGSIVNLIVIVHWLFSGPSNCSPSAALPFADFCMCLIGASIRYGLETTGSYESKQREEVVESLTERTSNSTPTFIYEGQKFSDVTGFSFQKALVIILCLVSLHVIAAVAMYRLLFVVNCVAQRQSREGKPAIPLIVLASAFLFSLGVYTIFYFAGGFVGEILLLGVSVENLAYIGNSSGAAFLIYLLSVCFIIVSCYLVLVCSLVYHELASSSSPNAMKVNPIQKIRDSLICPGRIIQDDPRLNQLQLDVLNTREESQEDRQMAMARQELRGRAFCSITGLLVALMICWILPLSLSLHAVFSANIELISMVPKMDALVFLSGVVHPFLYGEAWLAIPFCLSFTKKIANKVKGSTSNSLN